MLAMKLDRFIAEKRTIRTEEFFTDQELARDVQNQLTRLGLLDPPTDGKFGAISRLAASELFSRLPGAGPSPHPRLDWQLAAKVAAAKPETLFPVTPGKDLAGAIWQAMTARGHFLTRVPGWTNIVYVEGANTDGTPNDNAPNKFNDRRTVLTVRDGRPVLLGNWDATSEPGKFYTENPLNPKGAARIALDQFKSWNMGVHRGSGKDPHEALVLAAPIRVHRDLNRNFRRDESDPVDVGASFAVNQHWGFDSPEENIGPASAGCLVGRTRQGHREFMNLLKKDPRYEANRGYLFMSAIITAPELLPFR